MHMFTFPPGLSQLACVISKWVDDGTRRACRGVL